MGQLKSIHTYTLFSGTAYNKLTYDNYGHVSAKVIPGIFFYFARNNYDGYMNIFTPSQSSMLIFVIALIIVIIIEHFYFKILSCTT